MIWNLIDTPKDESIYFFKDTYKFNRNVTYDVIMIHIYIYRDKEKLYPFHLQS